MVCDTLLVDEELDAAKTHKSITVLNNGQLQVYVYFVMYIMLFCYKEKYYNSVLSATEERYLRSVVSSFYDSALLTSKILMEFA